MEYMKERNYVGDDSQLFKLKNYTLSDGKAQGVKATDVDNGNGLKFTVLADRCMDLCDLSFKSINMGYCSPCGIVAPSYYELDGGGWLRGFNAGFLTTCGLTTMGAPSKDEGEPLGMHGRISYTPAEGYASYVEYNDGIPVILLRGRMRQAVLHGEYLVLTRRIQVKYKENCITLQDTIENVGGKTVPFMLLYHFNFGYPLLDEKAALIIPSRKVSAHDSHLEGHISKWRLLQPPTEGYRENCYFHELMSDSSGNTLAGVYNSDLCLGAFIRLNINQMDHFVQWKVMGVRDYVVGLEAGNAYIDGRAEARKSGHLKFLKPNESQAVNLSIEFIDNAGQFEEIINSLSSFK